MYYNYPTTVSLYVIVTRYRLGRNGCESYYVYQYCLFSLVLCLPRPSTDPLTHPSPLSLPFLLSVALRSLLVLRCYSVSIVVLWDYCLYVNVNLKNFSMTCFVVLPRLNRILNWVIPPPFLGSRYSVDI